MACWKTVGGQGYARQGSGFLFDIGAKGTYFALVEEQDDPYEKRVTIGRHTQEDGRFPGPVYFQIPESRIPSLYLRAFAVDDTGESPVFYVAHRDADDETFADCKISKYSVDGTLLAEMLIEPYSGVNGINIQDIVYMNDVLVMTTTAQWSGPAPDFDNMLDTSYWIIYPDLDAGWIDATWSGTSADSLVPGHIHTKDRWMWQVVSSDVSSNEDGYMVYLWDDAWGFWDYIEIDWIPGGTNSSEIDLAIDCNGKDLIISWWPPTSSSRIVSKYSFDVLHSLGSDPESPYTYDDVASSASWCELGFVTWNRGQYRVSRDGKTLMVNDWYVGDGAGTVMHLLSCSRDIVKYVRQRQRNDRKNAPRVGRANNQPTSLQHSLRSSRSGNFYMEEKVPCGC